MGVVLAASSGAEPEPRLIGDRPDAATVRRAGTLVDGMDLAQVTGQLVVARIAAARISRQERAALRTGRIGGLILFGSNVRTAGQVRSLTARAAALGRATGDGTAMLVAVDQEGGPVKRLRFAPPDRSAVELGRTGSVAAARSEGRRTGSALRSLGITMNLAPVADLDTGPERVMASRSFGHDTRLVGLLAAAFASGLEERGVAAVAKHFPGLGAGSANTDDAVAQIDRTERELRARELVPFRTMVERGVDAVMLTHAIVPSIHRGRPATRSARVVQGLLRRELGFDGVVVSDAIEAPGYLGVGDLTMERGCVEAVRAGIDLVLVTSTARRGADCARALRNAVRSGLLSEARVRDAAGRVLELKLRLGLGPRATS